MTITNPYALWVNAGTSRFDGTLQLGLAGTVTGVMQLQGATSGVVTLTVAAAAGTWTLTLPPDDGDAGEQLQTNGSGVTTWEAAASLRSVKLIDGTLDGELALAVIRATSVETWRYNPAVKGVGGDYDTHFAGVVADNAPWAMMHGGRVFNPINAFGYAAAAINALADEADAVKAQIRALEARLAQLEGVKAI